MSESTKFILRPKVRFSQFSDKKRNNEIVKESYEDDTNLQTSGPKIRDIVTLKRPVRIVDSTKSTNIRERILPMKNCEVKISICANDTAFENTQDTFSNMPVTEVPRILCNIDSDQHKEENVKLLQQNKNIHMQHDTSKPCRKVLQQKDKENKNTVLNRIISSKNIIKTRNSKYKQPIVSKKLKLSTTSNDTQRIDNTNFKKTGMAKSRSNVTKKTEKHTKTFHIKPTLSNVMPCYRYIKTGIIRNKTSTVKKTILYNTIDPKIKTSVESGIGRKQQNDTKTDDPNKKLYIISEAVGKLAQPEYNSIMCTLDKLKEIKQQKIIRNINNLPFIQKNLLNEKISTALDFPLDEVLFKNLVDLSIDDKQVPTITRTKDPEPRQKDIKPKLSDFFVPEDTKDICIPIHVKLRASKINEDWNICKISNKILDWRYSLDNIQ